VTTGRKRTAREVWEAIEEASFRDELDRILHMSAQELEAELLKDGFRPEELAAPEQTEGEKAKPDSAGPEAAKDHPPNRWQLVRGWLHAMRLRDEFLDEEADRIAEMSDEEFERLAATMPDPTHIPTEQELDERSAQRAARRR
jgi:hypothetical protein